MKIQSACKRCGNEKIAFEMRDWFSDDPAPPREAYGIWLVCLKCGNAWPDEEDEFEW